MAIWRLAPLLLSALILAGCANSAEAPTGGDVSSHTAASARTPTPTLSVQLPVPAGLTTASVTRVVDGDTIEVEIDGQAFKVRYIGIDTPETVDPNRPDGCYGHEASDHNKELVEGKEVELEKDLSDTDEFGRLLRYVWVDSQMVNAFLIRDGYARAETDFPEAKYRDAFLALQTEAREAQRGLWGSVCANATPVGTTTQTPPAGSGDEICDFSGTTQAVIKGSISSSEEKIYHVPGQDSYDETAITESRGERWFCTEQDAVDAGWRRSKS